jgi:acyl carrier protein
VLVGALERRENVARVVVAEVRLALLLSPDEALPMDRSYFDLGMTSLTLMTAKQRIEAALGLAIDATELFDHPTVEHLIAHLGKSLGSDTAGQARPDQDQLEERELASALLAGLYRDSGEMRP